MSEHPTPAELGAFLQESLPPQRFREVMQHLVQGCCACRSFVTPPSEDMPVFAPEEELGANGPGRGQPGRIRAEKASFRGLELLNKLLERSWAVRHEDPKRMATLARFAVEVAQNLDARRYAPELLADFEARAWGELGNAHRAADDLDEAGRAFGKAFALLARGTGDALLKTRLHELHASYLGARREFDLAFAALDAASSAHLELGDPHLAGRAILVKAIYTYYSGRPEQAILLTQKGLRMIGKDRDPNLAFFAIHNQLVFLVACNRFPEARRALAFHRANLEGAPGRINALKLRWLEGQISAGLQDWPSAESALREVREGFEDAGMSFHAALASLELALVWMRQGKHRDSEVLVLKTVEVFLALRIRREALGAMMVLGEAFKRQVATAGLLENTLSCLRRLENGPEIRLLPR
ncbi:MAG TPA: hypothetical protein VHC97_27305 [Thermoanaerobaculia bacterium]|nr:hypothetical protein [Thermoanaerobaculia bacterium]